MEIAIYQQYLELKEYEKELDKKFSISIEELKKAFEKPFKELEELKDEGSIKVDKHK